MHYAAFNSTAAYVVWSLPGVAVATFAGRAINQRLIHEKFVRVVFGGLLVIGAVLLLQALGWRAP